MKLCTTCFSWPLMQLELIWILFSPLCNHFGWAYCHFQTFFHEHDTKVSIYFFFWQIVTRHDRTLTIQLQNRNGHGILRKLGALTVHAEETIASRTAVEITLRCYQLANKDLFSLSVSREKWVLMFVINMKSQVFFFFVIGSILKNI